jgi:hypothetical protein
LDPLKLAYLAEFSIALNLVFIEYKFDLVSKRIAEIRGLIDNRHNGGEVLSRALKAPDEAGLFAVIKKTWFAKRLDGFYKLEHQDKTPPGFKKLLVSFFERILVLSGVPTKARREFTEIPKSVGLIFYPSNFWRGTLAAWTYSKLPDWNRKPCTTSVTLWVAFLTLIGLTLVIFNPLFFKLLLEKRMENLKGLFYFLQVFVGLMCGLSSAFLLPRPVSCLIARAVKSNHVNPRGRYYAFINIGAVTGIIAVNTVLAAEKYHIFPVYWYLTFGFILGTLLYPFLLSIGMRSLLEAYIEWEEYLGRVNSILVKKKLESLRAQPVRRQKNNNNIKGNLT